MKVLIVEDDRKIAAHLRDWLGENDLAVDVARNGADGLRLANAGDYDFVVLDVMLPRRDGWSIVQTLQRSGKQTPVLFLTACDSVLDRVTG